ncbi:Ig-like domain-containing protein [Bacillus sp. B-jedd]|uniref:Ig-like domain-containing protein n=1 Tax=Bacillus sp. B-jedd TaxID=1476857 RepID=UPI00051560B0|nr:Ig-like domain-containing protein [Bacillus sp. B-jedd]CEG28510.1 hypothetical protein BN1002_03431 [Bacillus sp. B-jedd]
MRLSRKETYARLKKQSRFTRVLAGMLAVLMVIYNLSYSGVIWPVLAQGETGAGNDVFTLTVLNAGQPVTNEPVTIQNANDNTMVFTKATNSDGIASFPELTAASFGDNTSFEFQVLDKKFTQVLMPGTVKQLVYDISTGKVTENAAEPPKETDPNPEPELPKTYEVSVEMSGKGKVMLNDKEYKNAVSIEEGNSVKIDIKPDPNYVIKSIIIDEKEEKITKDDSFTKTVEVTGPITIKVNFALKTYKITFIGKGNGEMWNSSNEVISSKGGEVLVQHGENSFFTFAPTEGHHVEQLKIDGEIEDHNKVPKEGDRFKYTFTSVTKDRNVEITFSINKYTIETKVNGGNGKIEVDRDIVYHGENVLLKITPENISYRLAELTVNGAPIDLNNLEENEEEGYYTYSVKNITQDTNISGKFEEVVKEEGTWSQFIEITPVKGSLAKPVADTGGNLRIYSNDAVVKITPKEPYSKIDIFYENRWYKIWKDEVLIEKPTAIERVVVKEKGFKFPKEIKFPKLLLVFDKLAPVLEVKKIEGPNATTIDGTVWYSGPVTISGKVTNPIEDFDGVKYSTEIEKVYLTRDKDGKGYEATFDAATGNYSFTTEDLDYQGTYKVWAKDKAGNVSEVKEVPVYIDKTKPTLADGKTAVTFVQENESFFAKAINFLSFGTFFNKDIEITVKVKDEASGIKDIVLKTDKEKVVPELVAGSFKKDGLTAEAKFILKSNKFEGTFTVDVTDNVKNANSILVTKDNSNIDADNNGITMVEQTAPIAKINVKPKNNVSTNGGNQYNGDVAFEISAEDADSGVNTVVVEVNGKKFEHDYSQKKEMQKGPLTYEIDTSDPNIKINEDGSYHVSVYVIDNAGNTAKLEKTTYRDLSAPRILDYVFAVDNGKGKYEKVGETADVKSTVELTEYGFYFKLPTRVTVKAEDPKVPYEYTSKVKSMAVYLKDYDNGKLYAVQAGGKLKDITAKDIDSITPVVTSDELTFNVPAAFKGQIFAKATDNVNNTGAFETPDGTVVENEKQHLKEKHIIFEKGEARFKDQNNRDLYLQNVDIKLSVKDTYSGLAEIEWSVVAPNDKGNNQGGKIKINNDKTYAPGSDAAGWKQTRTEKNLVLEMVKMLSVKNNSNDIIVKVKMTDRAGNSSEEKLEFSIDKTAPDIQVSFDNNNPDREYKDYYNADRTATIVITERNFNKDDVDYLITNKDGSVPALSGWTTRTNAADPDKTTHTATIRFAADGDYTFDIKYKDRAGNQAAPVAQSKFTIDKTNPVVNVSYSNNSNANGHFYNAKRTATISIAEHNFDPGRIRIAGKATHAGKNIAFPALSGWTSRGDVHTATISYAADGEYSFDIDFIDKAGNAMADYKAEQFIVDLTPPALEITGVKDKSANKGDLAPVISFSDINFNRNAVSIKLTGANRKAVALDGKYTNTPNGQVFTFNNFAKVKENDDLYTLTATIVDFAGNESTQTVRFSVNRFGSVYAFDESLQEIGGKYVKEERDVILTETNVDSLKKDTIKVKLTKNGTPADLVEGTDYTVAETGGEGEWSQYKYVIGKALFASDGRYTVTLYSEDAAGNINENIDETKKAEISFGVDKTAPVIVPIDIEDNKQYAVDTKPVTISIKDNLVLDKAAIYLNGKEVEYKENGENYSFEIPSSNNKQKVRIVASDAAGNEFSREVTDLLITTNPIIRWYNDTKLFVGSLSGLGVVSIALAGWLLHKRRSKAAGGNAFEDKVS